MKEKEILEYANTQEELIKESRENNKEDKYYIKGEIFYKYKKEKEYYESV